MKTIMITGGTSGIGAALCALYLNNNHRVIAVGRRASQSQPNLIAVCADIATAEGRAAVINAAQAHGPIDGLINNAGVQFSYPIVDGHSQTEALLAEVTTNLIAPIALGHALMTDIASQDGFICNVSSGLAYVPKARSPLYCATKAALSMYTRAARLQAPGVHLAEVILPLVDTPMTKGRGKNKMSASEAAQAIFDGLAKRRRTISVGKARWLPLILRLLPGLPVRLLNRGDPLYQ